MNTCEFLREANAIAGLNPFEFGAGLKPLAMDLRTYLVS